MFCNSEEDEIISHATFMYPVHFCFHSMNLSNFNLFTACGDMESTSEDGKADEGKLHVKRQEMDKGKVVDAVKRYSYLLGQTELLAFRGHQSTYPYHP